MGKSRAPLIIIGEKKSKFASIAPPFELRSLSGFLVFMVQSVESRPLLRDSIGDCAVAVESTSGSSTRSSQRAVGPASAHFTTHIGTERLRSTANRTQMLAQATLAIARPTLASRRPRGRLTYCKTWASGMTKSSYCRRLSE